MGKITTISWTKSTLNLSWGCTKVTSECEQCYMFRMSPFYGRDPSFVNILAATKERTEKKIREVGGLVFVNSMSDTFHNKIPNSVRDIWFEAFRNHPEKHFQILTKRPAKALDYFKSRAVPENCWIGVSVGIKKTIPRIDILRRIDCKIRFISFEPLLEDLGSVDLTNIQWGIVGGESDRSKPRIMRPEWAASLMNQLKEQRVAAFFKQMGGKGGSGAGGETCPCCSTVHHEYPVDLAAFNSAQTIE